MEKLPPKHTLSKSTFLRGLNCPKSLYLYKFFSNLKDPLTPAQLAIFQTGTNVGELARDLFPGGIDASPENPFKYQESVAYTADLIAGGEKVIYEAAFQHNGSLCAIDILVKEGDAWHGYEVKSSTGVKDVYINDVSFQYYVIKNSGLPLESISLVHINNQYARNGTLDLEALFTIEPQTDAALENWDFVEENIDHLNGVITTGHVPNVDIGPYCSDPYDCDFTGHCWKHIPGNSVFDISRLKKAAAFDLYRQGIIRQEDIPDSIQLSEKQQLQVDCHKRKETHVDPAGIREFLKTIEYPLYFMDFETFNPAVPLFNNSRPYQQVPFQYSLHYMEKAGSRHTRHFEFLAEAGNDPRRNFIEKLLHDTSFEGDVLVYNRAFEVGRLNELARDFPEYAPKIEELISRIKDLMEPFQKKYIYKPEMRGSYSIKAVLPALVPGSGYDNLGISDGGTAMLAYENLQSEKDPAKVEEVRANLLEYCKMDTFAMIELLEALGEY